MRVSVEAWERSVSQPADDMLIEARHGLTNNQREIKEKKEKERKKESAEEEREKEDKHKYFMATSGEGNKHAVEMLHKKLCMRVRHHLHRKIRNAGHTMDINR